MFNAGVSVSTERTLKPTRPRLNVGPASLALAGIHSTPGSRLCLAGWARDYCEPCSLTYDTPTQCRLNVGPPYVTPVQPRTSIVSQCISTRRKICWLKAARVFSGTKAWGIQSQGWGSGVNSSPPLNQHCINMWINSIFRDLPILQRPKFIFYNPKLAHGRHCYTVSVYSSKKTLGL